MKVALAWLLGGALVGAGLVGYLTGILLVPVGVAIIVYAARRRVGLFWLALVGAGTQAVVLLYDEYVNYPDGGCRYLPDVKICISDESHEIFLVGAALIGAGVVIGVVSSLVRRDRSPEHPPEAFHSRAP